jgi:flavodoxin
LKKDEMKTLVAFYSKNGHTRIIGKKLIKTFRADSEEIIDLKDRSDVFTWAKSAFNEELKTPTQIAPPKKNSQDYDLVIIGTPIWDGITPSVKAYLLQNRFRNVAFFATFGAAAEDVFYEMEQLSKKKPLSVLEVQDMQISRKEDEPRIKNFEKEIMGKMK